MFELYDLVRTKDEHSYIDSDGNKIVIPKGTKAVIIEKYNGWYMVEFFENENVVPIVYDFEEDQIERVED